MSDDFYSYIQNSPETWLRHDGVKVSSTGWHFCFPKLYITPASQTRFYQWGANPGLFTNEHVAGSSTVSYFWRPSTEQFFGGNHQTRFPINKVVSCCSVGLLVCLEGGQLVTREQVFTSDLVREINVLGLGPVSQPLHDAKSHTADAYGVQRITRQYRTSATPLVGNAGNLAYAKFICVDHQVAVDDAGGLWFWGPFTTNLLGLVNDLPISNNNVVWPSRKEIFSYETATGTVTSETPLVFVSCVRHDADDTAFTNTIYALTDDGKLLAWKGGFPPIAATLPDRFFVMEGFVKSVSVTNGGVNYTSAPTITVSAPDSDYGTKPTFEVDIAGGAVSEIRLIEPGWGYASAPTVTLTGGGGTGATVQCSLFTGTWAFVSGGIRQRGACLAIDSEGKAYAIGGGIHPNAQETDLVKSRYPYLIPGQGDNTYAKGYLSNLSNMAVLLTTDGNLDTYGLGPDGTLTTSLTRHSSSTTFIDVAIAAEYSAAVAALDVDGDLHTYGHAQGGLCGRGYTTDTYSSIGKVPGSAKWTAVFGCGNTFVANRDESFDADGNRIDPIPPGLT